MSTKSSTPNRAVNELCTCAPFDVDRRVIRLGTANDQLSTQQQAVLVLQETFLSTTNDFICSV
jgi:hypothetical protein